MRSFSEVIDTLGGYLTVAVGIGAAKGTVSAMKTRNSIPPDYWPQLARFAADNGHDEVTVEFLAGLREPRKRRTQQAAA